MFLSKLGVEYKSWTPHIYDYMTDKGALSTRSGNLNCKYIKIGGLYFCWFYAFDMPSITINTMLQIRNTPFKTCLGGQIYISAGSGNANGGANATVQISSVGTYFRPNITGTIYSIVSGFLVGTDYITV